jgi:hypothetical protein
MATSAPSGDRVWFWRGVNQTSNQAPVVPPGDSRREFDARTEAAPGAAPGEGIRAARREDHRPRARRRRRVVESDRVRPPMRLAARRQDSARLGLGGGAKGDVGQKQRSNGPPARSGERGKGWARPNAPIESRIIE